MFDKLDIMYDWFKKSEQAYDLDPDERYFQNYIEVKTVYDHVKSKSKDDKKTIVTYYDRAL